MRAFLKFNSGLLRSPAPVQAWLLLLIAVNLVVPLFFLGHLEAQVAVIVMLISVLLMTGLTALTGFTRLIGLGHIPWVPMVVWLWTRLDQLPADEFFGVWVRVLILLNTISLVIDTVDVVRYAAGDRSDMCSPST